MLTIPGLVIDDRRHSKVLQQPLAAPRTGLMLHYDDSSRDDWAVEWFQDPRCTNGYTWLVLDDGRVVELADPGMRTPHAGACKTPLANSRFYGIAAATNGLVLATAPQRDAIARICTALFEHHGWTTDSVSRRITGHDLEAVWTPTNTARRELWGKLGRKVDPTGQRPDRQPIIDVAELRWRVQTILSSRGPQLSLSSRASADAARGAGSASVVSRAAGRPRDNEQQQNMNR